MNYKIKETKLFLKDLKEISKSGFDISELQETVILLAENGELPLEYKTHLLKKHFSQTYDSHLDDDIILLWRKNRNVITLIRIGTHGDLF